MLYRQSDYWDIKLLALVIMKITSVVLYDVLFMHNIFSMINQSLFKLSDIQKLLKYLVRIVTSTFKNITGGCAVQSVLFAFPDCGGCPCTFSIMFVLYLNDLLSEALSSTLSVSYL